MSGKKFSDNRLNLCTVTLNVAPEAYGEEKVEVEFSCVKDGFSVKACKWYRPHVAAGLVSPYECAHFSRGCTCSQAQRYAKQRANRIIRKMLSEKK